MPFLELGGTRFELRDGETTVGSGAQASWRLASHDLAAKHFIVAVDEAGSAALRPCSDHSVVVLNGRQAPPNDVTLSSGDLIAAGTARFRFLARESDASLPGQEEPVALAHLVDDEVSGAYQLSHRTITIGRDTSSVIRLKDPRVSRFHADIRAEAGVFVLYPLGSGGTYVNAERLTAPRVLQEGDRIEIGDTVLRFTRQALPDDVHPADAELELNDPQAMRATLLHGTVNGGERGAKEGRSRLWLLAAAAVGLAILGYIIFV